MSLAAFSPGIGESAAAVRSYGTLLLTAFQSVPPAPGREPGLAQPPPPAPSGGSSQGPGLLGGMLPLLIMVLPMLLLLFFSSRSQQKKQAAVLASLKKGDRVLTQSGIVGRLVELGDRYAKLEIAPSVRIEVLRSGLVGIDTPETQASVEKK